MIAAHYPAVCVFIAASLLHMQGAAAVPEPRPESVSTKLSSPPNWPPAVRYSGMINLTTAGTSNGKPSPVHVQTGPFFGWSVCDASSPQAQLQRLDSDYGIPLPPAPPEMWVNGSSVTVCPVRTKFNDLMGSCTAEPLWGSLITGWPLACANCNDLLSAAKAVCPTWTEATDIVRGLTATKWTATNCKPAHIAHPYPTNLTTHLEIWYDATDGATPVRMRSSRDQVTSLGGAVGIVTSSTIQTFEITTWDVGSVGAQVFAHCKPSDEAHH